MLKTKKLVFSALCVAMGLALPLAFHAVPDAGKVFLPMHIPVLICGLVCGAPFGAICGVLTPALSSLLTGMPVAAMLPGMIVELGVYGLTAGIMMRVCRTGRPIINIYISLVTAMLCGRVVAGVLNALLFRAGDYSLQIWLTASFATALPGIVIQLLFLPSMVFALQKARVLPEQTASA